MLFWLFFWFCFFGLHATAGGLCLRFTIVCATATHQELPTYRTLFFFFYVCCVSFFGLFNPTHLYQHPQVLRRRDRSVEIHKILSKAMYLHKDIENDASVNACCNLTL